MVIAAKRVLLEAYAEKLLPLAPAASHLIHMPSHIYFWMGRYRDAEQENLRAIAIYWTVQNRHLAAALLYRSGLYFVRRSSKV